MSKLSARKTVEALELLKNYNGDSQYIKTIQYYTFIKKIKQPNDFELQYILQNHDFKPIQINKIVKVLDWWGEKKREEFNFQHPITKLKIIELLGETDSNYHVSMLYRQSQTEPVTCFIPKSVLLDTLEDDNAYEKMDVDFTWFNKILSNEDKKLYPHQETAVKFLRVRKRCILSDDMGLGKSMSSIVAAISGEFKKVLIVCPASLKGTKGWQKQLQTFVPESEICVIDGDNWISNKRFTIINYDILDRHHTIPKENGKKTRKSSIVQEAFSKSNMLKENFDLIIVDEVHKIPNSSSTRYETLLDYLTRANLENIWLLTGTIITKSPLNYMNILKLIFHPITNNWQEYVERFCDARQIYRKGEKDKWTEIYLNKKNKRDWFELNDNEKEKLKIFIDENAKKLWVTSGSSNLEELFEKTKTIYLRRLKSMIPGMKGKKIEAIYYDLTKEERIEYEKLWEEYENSQRELGKTSFNKDLTEGILMRMAISKFMINRTISLVDSHISKGNKVVIACAFNEEISELQKYYKDKCVIYKGGVSQKNKDLAEEKFMEDPNTMVFIGNIQAAGVGLTLISSHICVFSSYDWVPANNFQIMDRIDRLGQKHVCEIYFQLFRNTISEDMWENVIKKEIVINKIIKTEEEK